MKQHRILSRVLSVLFCLALCTQLTGCVHAEAHACAYTYTGQDL